VTGLIPIIRPPGLIAPPPTGAFFMTPLTLAEATPANFSALIHQDVFGASHAIWSMVQADGGDIRVFADQAKTLPLPAEIEIFDKAAKTLKLWTRITTSLTAGQQIWVQVGSDSGVLTFPADAAALGRNNVWQDEQYAGHDPSIDATGAVTPAVTGTTTIANPNGGVVRNFPNDTDVIDLNQTTHPAPFSWSGFIYPTATGNRNFLVKADGNFILRRDANGRLALIKNFTGGVANFSGGSLPLNAWTFAAVGYDDTLVGNVPSFYINGALQSLAINSPAPSGTPTRGGNWLIGLISNPSEAWLGRLGEFRLRSGAKTAAHVAAEASNMNNPGAFFTAGVGA